MCGWHIRDTRRTVRKKLRTCTKKHGTREQYEYDLC